MSTETYEKVVADHVLAMPEVPGRGPALFSDASYGMGGGGGGGGAKSVGKKYYGGGGGGGGGGAEDEEEYYPPSKKGGYSKASYMKKKMDDDFRDFTVSKMKGAVSKYKERKFMSKKAMMCEEEE